MTNPLLGDLETAQMILGAAPQTSQEYHVPRGRLSGVQDFGYRLLGAITAMKVAAEKKKRQKLADVVTTAQLAGLPAGPAAIATNRPAFQDVGVTPPSGEIFTQEQQDVVAGSKVLERMGKDPIYAEQWYQNKVGAPWTVAMLDTPEQRNVAAKTQLGLLMDANQFQASKEFQETHDLNERQLTQMIKEGDAKIRQGDLSLHADILNSMSRMYADYNNGYQTPEMNRIMAKIGMGLQEAAAMIPGFDPKKGFTKEDFIAIEKSPGGYQNQMIRFKVEEITLAYKELALKERQVGLAAAEHAANLLARGQNASTLNLTRAQGAVQEELTDLRSVRDHLQPQPNDPNDPKKGIKNYIYQNILDPSEAVKTYSIAEVRAMDDSIAQWEGIRGVITSATVGSVIKGPLPKSFLSLNLGGPASMIEEGVNLLVIKRAPYTQSEPLLRAYFGSKGYAEPELSKLVATGVRNYGQRIKSGATKPMSPQEFTERYSKQQGPSVSGWGGGNVGRGF